MKIDTWMNITKWLPKKLIHACFIMYWAFATTHDEGCKMTPDEMTWGKANEIWDRYNK